MTKQVVSRWFRHRVVVSVVGLVGVVAATVAFAASRALAARRALPVPLNDDLEWTLQQHSADWQTTRAMRTLVDDYADYHRVFVVLGGAFAIGLLVLGVSLWTRFRRLRRNVGRAVVFERRLSLAGALGGLLLGVLMAVIVVANATNAADPLPGLLLAGAHPTPNPAAVDSAVVDWLNTGSGPVPAVVTARVHDRLAWQQPKAIICGLLLMAFAGLTVKLWRALLRRVRAGQSPSQLKMLLAGQAAAAAAVVLLMVMFIGNTQASIAPLAITVLGCS